MAMLREAGYDKPVYLHGALEAITSYYASRGINLGDVKLARGASKADLAGAIALCPPTSLKDLWTRRFPDPITALASGWMRVRARARQRGVELPLVISDHADCDNAGLFQDPACRLIRDLLCKHDRPADLKSALRQSLGKSATIHELAFVNHGSAQESDPSGTFQTETKHDNVPSTPADLSRSTGSDCAAPVEGSQVIVFAPLQTSEFAPGRHAKRQDRAREGRSAISTDPTPTLQRDTAFCTLKAAERSLLRRRRHAWVLGAIAWQGHPKLF